VVVAGEGVIRTLAGEAPLFPEGGVVARAIAADDRAV
jgi:hypothetical protein